MNDREILEKAAKAAGIRAKVGPDGVMRDTTGFDGLANIFIAPRWNPLEDDGDALRLAVKCGIRLEFVAESTVSAATDGIEDLVWSLRQEPHRGEPYAATRRAIVRAAASLARD